MSLHANPAGLLGRFPLSGFMLALFVASLPCTLCMLRTRILDRFALLCFGLCILSCFGPSSFALRSVSQLTQNALKRIEMQKYFTSLTHYALCASGKAREAKRNLIYPMSRQGPKEYPCQFSCRFDQNCER